MDTTVSGKSKLPNITMVLRSATTTLLKIGALMHAAKLPFAPKLTDLMQESAMTVFIQMPGPAQMRDPLKVVGGPMTKGR